MKKIKGDISISEMKRCYVGDAKIYIDCPVCASQMIHDFMYDYLNYPEVGKEDTAYFYCEVCDDAGKDGDFEMPIKVISAKIEIEYDPAKIVQA